MSYQESSIKLKLGKNDLLKALNTRNEQCLDEIISCQSELDLLSEKQSEEKRKTSQQFEGLKKPHLDRRTELIRVVPNFWVHAIESHPQLSLLLDDKVAEVLRYMTKIETEDAVKHENGMSFKIHFLFEENPYIENHRLTKEISLLKVEGELRMSSTAINWKSNGKSLENEEASVPDCHGDSSKRKEKNFFDWFCDNENPEDDIFSYFQAICQNPLPYSPFFYDNSDEEVEENSNGTGGGNHKSRYLLSEVKDLNLNDDDDGGEMNVD